MAGHAPRPRRGAAHGHRAGRQVAAADRLADHYGGRAGRAADGPFELPRRPCAAVRCEGSRTGPGLLTVYGDGEQTDVAQLRQMHAAATEQVKTLQARHARASTLALLHAARLDRFAVYVDQPAELICQLYDQLGPSELGRSAGTDAVPSLARTFFACQPTVVARASSVLMSGRTATAPVRVRTTQLRAPDTRGICTRWPPTLRSSTSSMSSSCARS